MRKHFVLCISGFIIGISCKNSSHDSLLLTGSDNKVQEMRKDISNMVKPEIQKSIVIKPGFSIGTISLGPASKEILDKTNEIGFVKWTSSIFAWVENGEVVDIWIDNLRALEMPIEVNGEMILQDTPLEDLQQMFGPCEEVPVKGGIYFNCANGLALGIGCYEDGSYIQIRINHR